MDAPTLKARLADAAVVSLDTTPGGNSDVSYAASPRRLAASASTEVT
jgi:hypothetical protein